MNREDVLAKEMFYSDVVRCARCGKDHKKLLFIRADIVSLLSMLFRRRMIVDFEKASDYVTVCPAKNEVLHMQILETSDNPTKEGGQ